MKKILAKRLVIRQRGGTVRERDAASYATGKSVVFAGGVALNDDRARQTFDQALRETIVNNRAALIKLAKH